MRHKAKKDIGIEKKTSKKKKLLKAVIIFLCVLILLVGGAVLAGYYFMNSTGTGPSPAGKHHPGKNIKKSETVYVDTDSSGNPYSVVVDAYVRNNTESDEIVDITNLKNIVNINGNEEYKKNKDGTITWPANGADMYYEGEASCDDIPVTMEVKYFLDGKPISGDKLQGKSGKLEIHIKYHNNKIEKVGKQEVPVPFLVLSALVVNDNSLNKIKINQGKVLNQAGVKVAIGVSAPGIIEELKPASKNQNAETTEGTGSSKKTNNIENELIIKGVAKNFEGNEIISMVSNDMLKFVSKKNINKLNLDKKITRLDKATKRIKKGTAKLSKGIHLLNKKTPELTNGITQAKEGSQKLATGSHKAMKELNEGSVNLGKLGKAIHAGIVYIDDKISDDSTANPPATGIGTKSKAVSDKINNINGKIVGAKGMRQSDITAMQSKVASLDKSVMTDDEKQMLQNYLDVMDTLIDGTTVEPYAELSANATAVSSGVEEIDQLLDGQQGEDVPDGLQHFIDNNPDLEQLKGDDGKYMGLVGASELWNEKNDEMSDEIYKLDNDKDSLVSGAKELAQGMRKLDNGATKFGKGIKRLDKGSTRLSKGMNKYYDKGIKKIVNMYNDQLSGVAKNLIAMKKIGDAYDNFSGKPESMDGSVTFMYFTPIGDW